MQNEAERVTLDVPEAGRRLGLGRATAYRAAQRGELPCLKFGRRLVVPVAAFEQMLETAEAKPEVTR